MEHRRPCRNRGAGTGATAWGRRITERQLAALKARQYKPGQSGNPGGSYKKRTLLDAAMRLMKASKLQPSDSIADFLNLLGED